MNVSKIIRHQKRVSFLTARWILLSVIFVSSAAQSQQMFDYSSAPFSNTAAPMIMLLLSRDSNLWIKAYNDYSDLDGDVDGDLETTYENDFKYYGYFNSAWCYRYDDGSADEVEHSFEPVTPAANHRCSGAQWSGNFLNWLTMTRMDIVRQVLYGGFRVVDEAQRSDGPDTILQRALLPNDIHAFVKVVKDEDLGDGVDISHYTPFTSNSEGAYSFCNVTHFDGNIPGGSNVETLSGRVNVFDNEFRPRIKVANGAHYTWAGAESVQCMYADDEVGGQLTETFSASADDRPANYEFAARVQVCIPGKDAGYVEGLTEAQLPGGSGVPEDYKGDESRCRPYVSLDADAREIVTYKPYGTIQQYGESGRYKFGLMTGSYQRNAEGGVLRKNIELVGGSRSTAANVEVNPATGQFTYDDTSDSIIKTLDALRVSGWDYRGRRYPDCYPWNVKISEFLRLNSGDTNADERCRDWGNPIAEMYLEALRYFSGAASPTSLYAGGPIPSGADPSPTPAPVDTYASDSDFIPGLTQAAWRDPFSTDNACANCAIIVLSTGQNNFDNDNLSEALAGGDIPSLSLATLKSETDAIGQAEGLSGGRYLVGSVDEASTLRGECDAKTITDLSEVTGPCPDVPNLEGGYNIAGAARYAFNNDIHAVDGVQSINTFTISLAESRPSVTIKTPNGNEINLVPTCRSSSTENASPHWELTPGNESWQDCTLAEMIMVEEYPPNTVDADGNEVKVPKVYGRYLMAWEDSSWGADYDNDTYSVIEWCTSGTPGDDCEIADTDTERNRFAYSLDYNPLFGVADRDNNGDGINDRGDFFPTGGPTRLEGGVWYNYRIHSPRPSWGAINGVDQVRVRVSILGASAGDSLRLGYAISGTSENPDNNVRLANEGPIPPVSIDTDDGAWTNEILRFGGYNMNSTDLTGDPSDDDTTQRVIWSKNARLFNAGGTGGADGEIKDPLYYAAKYGNENFNADGEDPSAYFKVKNPAKLVDAMEGIFLQLESRSSSGAALSVKTERGGGQGAIVQSYYLPEKTVSEEDADGNWEVVEKIRWVGEMHALWLDDRGRLREDRGASGGLPGNAVLDTTDRVVIFDRPEDGVVDGEPAVTMVTAYDVDADGNLTGSSARFSIADDRFSPIWSAQEGLSDIDSAVVSRPYRNEAGEGRYIFTALDHDQDGLVIPSGYATLSDDPNAAMASDDVFFEFEADNFTVANSNIVNYLDLPSNDDTYVTDFVNYIRGDDNSGNFRSRTLAGTPYRLADIVNSSPAFVGNPTYTASNGEPINRRRVVYVGSNGGMLHAFNAGFFSSSRELEDGTRVREFSYQLTDGEPETVEHPLGSELWAYVPYNLLPHLKWFADENYSHVYYMDGGVQSFDARLWLNEAGTASIDDSVYPNGWGTILVAGMRFGGGDYALDHDDDVTTPNITTRSAYVILDVTDPEHPPKLIAELTDEDLGFTVSMPELVSNTQITETGTANSWYLVFGSGPRERGNVTMRQAIDEGVSGGPATLFVFDLVDRQPMDLETVVSADVTDVTDPDNQSFIGNIAATDWGGDGSDDVIYFGTTSGTPIAPGGKMRRGVLQYNSEGVLTDIVWRNRDLYNGDSLPFTGEPAVLRDSDGAFWVFFGSGRFLVSQDNLTDQQQYFFGIKEPVDGEGLPALSAPVADSTLFDTSGLNVFADGRVFTNPNGSGEVVLEGSPDGATATFDEIETHIAENNNGWKFRFSEPLITAAEGTAPGRIRTTTRAVFAGDNIIIAAYRGTGEDCKIEGDGFLYGRDLKVGLAAPFGPLGLANSDGTIRNGTSAEVADAPEDYRAIGGVDLGVGVPTQPTVIRPSNESGDGSGASSCDEYRILTQTSGANVMAIDISCEPLPAGRKGWREIPITW